MSDPINDAVSAMLNAKPTPTKLPPLILDSKSLGEYLRDDTPMPDDLIAPRILTPGGMLVIAGAPKAGKSDFFINFFVHLAAGKSFLGFWPARPLRIYYLQAEMPHIYMNERIRRISLDPAILAIAENNIYFSNRFVRRLDNDACEDIVAEIKKKFGDIPPNIIAVDPLANVFYSDNPNADENNNAAMLAMMQRLQHQVLDRINPDGGLAVCHHTAKLSKEQIKKDPFNALRGASSLRGFYSTGMLLFRENEQQPERTLYVERRYALDDSIPEKTLLKLNGIWQEIHSSRPLVKPHYQDTLDAERNRKRDVICGLLYEEAVAGKLYTGNSFAERFENKEGLGSHTTIRARISVLQTKGYIKSFFPPRERGKKQNTGKWGLLCVQGMRRGEVNTQVDPETGEIMDKTDYVLPTHYKCPQTGAKLEVSDPQAWPQDDDNNPIAGLPASFAGKSAIENKPLNERDNLSGNLFADNPANENLTV